MKTYAAACDESLIDTADEMTVQEHRMNAVSVLRTNKPVLEEPEQMKLRKGDVVFAMHKVAHLGGISINKYRISIYIFINKLCIFIKYK